MIMPFGRSAKPNNRSQQHLVESAGPAAVSGSSQAAAGTDPAGAASASSSLPAPASSAPTSAAAAGQGISPSGVAGAQPGPGHGHGQAAQPQAQAQSSQSSQSQAHQVGVQPNNQGPSSASGPSTTSSESFVQDLRAASQPPPQLPPSSSHLYSSLPTASSSGPNNNNSSNNNLSSSSSSPPSHHQSQLHQLHPLNTASPPVPDARVRKAVHEFADAVARSQSQRYHQVATPVQPNPSFGSSFEDLSRPYSNTPPQPPLAYHPQLHHQQQPHQHQHQHQHQQQQQLLHQQQLQQQQRQQHQNPPAPVESRRSTRRLIKNILAGAPNLNKAEQQARPEYHPHHQPSHSQHTYDNTAGLARRPSKRISNPPALRTGPSQVSLDQQPADWQSPGPQTQPSPLQNNPHEFQLPTLRRVPTNQDNSPYSDDGGFIHPHGQIHTQAQLTPDQQQQLNQVAFDPATRQYQFISHSPQRQGQTEGNQPVYSGLLVADQHRNPETISQLSHESPATEGDYLLSSSNVQSAATSPAVRYSAQDFPSRSTSLQPHSQQLHQQQSSTSSPDGQQQEHHSQQGMAPQGGPPQTRRSQETEKSLRGDIPPGPPPGYRHSQQPSNSMNTLPSAPQGPQGASGPNPSFRQSTIQDRQQQQQQQFEGAAEQGRNSPQPSEDPEKAFKDLLTKYKNVKRLYFDGKTQIEQLNGQVEQLQNAVANQRITQSRTALDDNEYMTRFNRLNGAINNLSFNIRKDWTSVPSWLESYVSTDALKTGKQEMTAVGRAVITRWIVEEIFHGCFHPGLDPELSRQLKEIEQNIRRGNYTMTSQEEHDALTSKVVTWRMTTLDGLQHVLNSAESSEHRQDFIRKATSNLTAYLFQHLAEPPPAGVDGSASMIIELAVSIAANLPMESRDVAIIYPLPQDNLQPNIMEVEKAPLPPIETRPPDSDGDADSREENGKDSGGEKSSSKERSSKSRAALPPKDSNKLRFAGFLAVEVRGRQVLVKAPVWTLG
ncbi:hypothetical protein KVR01_008601 [Diaporthe batatas]|uniref:uncharacterized protein n=1 Tax=Diaporthe batatas TaxID=748121 RepID=UPI001D038EF1|nr:uncharacterized protein KVR01_008601 [Diaporthe batatas]KAG8161614.1 hypothetical protein KVR01_008601 [Diaporthe batatas]